MLFKLGQLKCMQFFTSNPLFSIPNLQLVARYSLVAVLELPSVVVSTHKIYLHYIAQYFMLFYVCNYSLFILAVLLLSKHPFGEFILFYLNFTVFTRVEILILFSLPA